MRSSRRRLTVLGAVFATVAAMATGATMAMATVTPAPAWMLLAAAGPTNLAPGATGKIAVYIQNVGGKASEGPITVTDALPAGILTTGTPDDTGKGGVWHCSPGAGQSTVTCTSEEEVPPGFNPRALDIPVEVDPSATTHENTVSVEGGGAAEPPATFNAPVTISETPAKDGVAAYFAGTYEADGTPTTQAGSHPYASDVGVLVNTVLTPNGKGIVPAGDPRTIAVDLPPGFLGNPTATLRCTEGLQDSECPIESQVGLATPLITEFGSTPHPSGVHSVQAPIGYPAKFTFGVDGGLYQANLLASLRSDEDYGVTITAPNLAQINPIYGSFASIWGDPASPSHDALRCRNFGAGGGHECGPVAKGTPERAFVTMGSDCAFQAEQPPFVKAAFDSWQEPGIFSEEEFAVPAATGCDRLSLAAALDLQPEKHEAATPSAFEARLTLPQEGLVEPEALATPPPKRTELTFPAGVTLNASAAAGLATCSEKQIGFREFGPAPNHIRFDKEPQHCPDASKVGTVEVQTELLDNPLKGSLFLASENENPFGSLLAVYLVIEDPSVGITIKLPGKMHADPQTGQLTTVFDDLPQAAVGKVRVNIKGGDRSPLATPDTCGQFATDGLLTPWSAPESGPPTPASSSFEVTSGPNGSACANGPSDRPFDLGLSAGSSSTQAGAFSPFSLRLTRPDGNQEIESLEIHTPAGFIASLKGVPECTDAEIAAAKTSTGKAEQANPACPTASQVGTTLAGAGVGPTPFYAPGKLYLAGPYKGAPLSVVAITPAVAGPFDLGNVVIRSALRIDPETARITAQSDSIPRLLKGIPTAIRDVRINLDRRDWALNPTSCEASAVKVTARGASGAVADLSSRFQVGGCENLAFKPKFSAKLKGGTDRGDLPAFSTTITYPQGQGYANTRFVQVTLPRSEFLEQSHIRTVCTRVQFAEGGGNGEHCPPGSIYGHVEATTPLLDQPLSGNAYLRSSDHTLPDIVLALKGPPSLPIAVNAAGRVDSIHGSIRTTFEAIPDAPISKVVLSMQGGKKGLLTNSKNLCTAKRKPRMTVRMIAQNNAGADRFPVLQNGCGKKKARKTKH
jgi:hypothetical protein